MKVILLMAVMLAINLQIAKSQITTSRPKIKENIATTLESPLLKTETNQKPLFPKKSLKYVIREPKKRLVPELTPTRKTKPLLMPKIDIKPRNFRRTEKTTRSLIMKNRIFTVTQRKRVKAQPKHYKPLMTPFKMLIGKNSTRIVRGNKSYNTTLTKELNTTKKLNETIKDDIKKETARNKRNTANINNLVRMPGLFKNFWFIQVPQPTMGEEMDAKEFIFIGPPRKKTVVYTSSKNRIIDSKIKLKKPAEIKIEDDVEIITDMPPDSY